MKEQALNRDYSTISPSARSLLLLKGLTDIPFAKEAATLIIQASDYQTNLADKPFTFWARLLHFEARYKSIDQLLDSLPVKNILELSSGFSFRGLQSVITKEINYIDTDLPEVIATKLGLLGELQLNINPKGNLQTVPLNALDSDRLNSLTDTFPEGEIALINEGLLVYLDIEEKKKLCSNIRSALQKRGGYWITADIYVKREKQIAAFMPDDKLQQFFKEHRIEENKFGSFEEAEAFFNNEGFVIDKEAEPNYHSLTSLKYLLASANEQQMAGLGKSGRISASWRLKLAD